MTSTTFLGRTFNLERAIGKIPSEDTVLELGASRNVGMTEEGKK